MRCDEVIRELAAPTDDRDATAIAEHLSGCRTCNGWARQAAQLDRLWEATRPPEPSPAAWGPVWVHVAQSLDSPVSPGPQPLAAPRPSGNGSAAKIVAHSAPPPSGSHAHS